MPDAYLDADAIRAATFVRHVEIHDTLGSTNDRAAELARDADIELPALVAARHQTAGRGRGKNTWWSADGALTFSVLLEPAALGISTANWPQLSLATAVAVCDALSSELNPQSAIRNPQSPASPSNGPTTSCSTAQNLRHPHRIARRRRAGQRPPHHRHRHQRQQFMARPDPLLAACAAMDQSSERHIALRHYRSSAQLAALALSNTCCARNANRPTRDTRPAASRRLAATLLVSRNKASKCKSNGKSIDGICLGIDDDGTLLVENVCSEPIESHSGSVRVL